MLIDHVGYAFFPGELWLRMIGRLAFPIFAWFLAVGYQRTRNKMRYFLRLLVWGIIAQVPFSLLFHNASVYNGQTFLIGTNVLFTFCFAFAALVLIEKAKDKKWIVQIISGIGVAVLATLAEIAKTDYGFYGVLTVVLIYVIKNKAAQVVSFSALTALFVIFMSMHPVQLLAVFALPLTWIKWPQQKRHYGIVKQLFYAFYPVHILIIWYIVTFL